MMRIAVFGAGAIGGYVAAKLAAAGRVDLSIVARGEHLAAIEAGGLRLIEDGKETAVPVRAASRAEDLGVQDYVVLALKAHSVGPALGQIAPLLGDGHRRRHHAERRALVVFSRDRRAARRHQAARRSIPAARSGTGSDRNASSAAVVYPAAEVDAPGLVRHVEGKRFSLGEPSGEKSERVARLAEEFIAAGLQAPVRDDIRSEIWLKLWGNLCFNPISALTGSTLEEIVADDGTRGVARAMMLEAQAIGESARRPLSRSASTAASRGPATSARTRPRCCRISSAAGRWKSTRW